jgi:hypothetical protein
MKILGLLCCVNNFFPGHWLLGGLNTYHSEQLVSYVIPCERSVVIVQYATLFADGFRFNGWVYGTPPFWENYQKRWSKDGIGRLCRSPRWGLITRNSRYQ